MNSSLQFYLRRLQGVTGIFPIGYFLLFHLKEGESFSGHGILFSVFLLWLPLAFHSLYGLFITWEGGVNVCCYRYVRNYMYLLQRITGVLIIVFLAVHVYSMKTGSYSASGAANFILFSGVLLSILHLANGLFGFLVDAGVTVGERAQKFAVIMCFFTFVVLAAYGVSKYFNFVG